MSLPGFRFAQEYAGIVKLKLRCASQPLKKKKWAGLKSNLHKL